MERIKAHRLWLLLCCWLTAVLALKAQTTDDKVVIADATESYVFTMANGQLSVKNVQETTYELTGSTSQTVQPYVLYGDNISLDKASCGFRKAEYRSATPSDVFFDDSKVCYFTDRLTPKHRQLAARFQRTFRNARYLSRILLQSDYLIRHKTLTITIPAGMTIRLVGHNLPPNVVMKAELAGRDSVFTYTMNDMAAWKSEPNGPSYGLTAPYLMVLGTFKDYDDLYRWSNDLAQVDTTIEHVDTLVAAITAGCCTAGERLASTYQWVQQHIHYVAFEAGIAGHQPERPAEVLRRGYGDCKGMALLLRTLLRAQGFDARLVYIGTREIPYNISEMPSLGTINHEVCGVVLNGQMRFLDATYRYVPVDYVPQTFQGKEAMIENGDHCMMAIVPVLPVSSSTDSLSYDYQLDTSTYNLNGQAFYAVSGELKEELLTACKRHTQQGRGELLARNLNADDHSCEVSQVAWHDRDSRHEWAVLTGHVSNSHAVHVAGNEIYV